LFNRDSPLPTETIESELWVYSQSRELQDRIPHPELYPCRVDQRKGFANHRSDADQWVRRTLHLYGSLFCHDTGTRPQDLADRDNFCPVEWAVILRFISKDNEVDPSSNIKRSDTSLAPAVSGLIRSHIDRCNNSSNNAIPGILQPQQGSDGTCPSPHSRCAMWPVSPMAATNLVWLRLRPRRRPLMRGPTSSQTSYSITQLRHRIRHLDSRTGLIQLSKPTKLRKLQAQYSFCPTQRRVR
jgi:hypothetical protein